MPRNTRNYRVSIVARLIVAVVGGYILTSKVVAALALLLPFQRAEATVTATLLSFAIYAGIVLTVFATHGLWRAGTCMVLAIAIASVAVWALAAVAS